ncbi:phage tail tip protein [Escherichia coli]
MGKGSSKGHTPREAKDNLKSTQLLSVIDAISEGPVEGPVDGLKSVLLNSTPVLDTEGNTNISGVTVVFRAGEQEQSPPEGFESSGSETVLGTEVKYDTPITRTITSANIDRLRFTFGVQALVETTSKGDRNPSEVRLLVQIQRNGGWVTEKDITIKGKTTSQYLASVVVGNLPPRPFNIRMRRMTPDSTTDQLQNKTLWSSYTEIIDVKQCYLDFFKGEIGKTHLAQELWTQIDNGQLAPDLAEIRTSITDVSNEITQTVNKKLEDQSAAIQQIQKVQVDTNNNLNSMWAVKLQQMQDGRLYIAGIGAGIENTPDGMQSQVLLAADRIAMINPANGNTKPMFVGQGDQIFMNEVFLKYLTAPTITSGGNPPAFSMTPDGKLTAKNADISGSVNANAGTLNNVTINENCQIKGKLSANQIEGDIVKTVGKAFPRDSRAPERWPSGTITVRIYDDQPFDRQIVIPAVAFSGAKHEREHTDIYSSCRLIVKKNGAEIYNRTALDNTLIYSGVIDMPAGHGHTTLEFSVSAWLVNDWYPTASISDLLVVVMKKATAGISIS